MRGISLGMVWAGGGRLAVVRPCIKGHAHGHQCQRELPTLDSTLALEEVSHGAGLVDDALRVPVKVCVSATEHFRYHF